MALSLFICTLTLVIIGGARVQAEQAIVVRVNDEPITNFDIEQRMRLKQLSPSPSVQKAAFKRLRAMLKAPDIQERFRAFAIKYRPKSREEVKALQKRFVARLRQQALRQVMPSSRNEAIRELINERLQLQEAKRLGITISKARLDEVIANIAKRNKKSVKEFKATFERRGIRFATLRERYRAQLAWQSAIRRRYGREIFIGQKDIDKVLASASGSGAKEIELKLQRVLLPLPGKIDQKVMAEKFALAERLRRGFKTCARTAQLAKGIAGARFEEMGRKRLSALPKEARPILRLAEPVQMTPPVFTTSGVEIYAVCAKRLVAGDDKQRTAVRRRLMQQELSSLSARLLQDLCNAAFIEFSGKRPRGKYCGI